MNLREFEEIISDEVNVKSVIIQNDVESYVTTKVSLNFKEIGKRIPESIKEIISLYKAGNWKINDDLSLSVGDNRLIKNEYEINLEPKNPSNTKPLSDKKSVVILNLEITKELEEEGFARDVVRIIQQSRKEADFMVSDKIIIDISGEENYLEICSKYKDYICDQCLGKFDKVYNNEYLVNTDIIGSKVNIKICLEK
jgi:isoleucyl-tRNA synthetase